MVKMNLCKNCGEGFPSELDLILHFNREHLTEDGGDGDSEDDDDSESSEEESDSGKGKATDFLTDVERALLLQALSSKDEDDDDLPVPGTKFKRGSNSNDVGEKEGSADGVNKAKAESRKKFPWTLFGVSSDNTGKPTRPDYECIFCGLTVARRNQFCDHLRVHIREKPYFCSVCDKSFSRGNHLKLHILTHSTSQSKKQVKRRKVDAYHHKCEVCGRTFSQKENFTRHLRIHEPGANAKPYKCEECPKNFSRSDHLKNHVNKLNQNEFVLSMHSANKPFECEHCQRRFTVKDYLDQHVKHVHQKNERFDCPTCGKSFTWKYTFSRHIRKFHPTSLKDAQFK